MNVVLVGLFCAFTVTSGSRSRDRGSCPRFCSKTLDPVCGSDGVIYSSECDLLRRTCGKAVKVQDSTLCSRPAGSQCAHFCPQDVDPACGSDSKTYPNLCILQVEHCLRGVRLSHLGPCMNRSKLLDENCPEKCEFQKKSEPVCASNGNVYSSVCEMKRQTCGQGVVQTSIKHCLTTKHCKDVCWKPARPVCGSDGKLYQNSCQMKVKSCGKLIFEVPLPHCVPQERALANHCPLSCENEVAAPICASDGNVYSNACDMKMQSCGRSEKDRLVAVDWKRCEEKADQCTMTKCSTRNINPALVCGSDGKTYESECELGVATCLRGTEMAHVGACLPVYSFDHKCPESCPEELEKDVPVCGSDGNVYRSECEMKRLTCGQVVVAVALDHCLMTRDCNKTCDAKILSVCGSDGRIYRNACEMRSQNCGRHAYEVPLRRCLALAGFQFDGCRRICPYEYDPVCGTDSKTYSNECFLQLENCRSRSLVRKSHHGKCGEPSAQLKNYLY